MIIKISRGSFVKGIIDYHEKKVAGGYAVEIENNTLEDSPSGKTQAFLENFELNTKVLKNKFAHFSFSLDPSEDISTEKFIELSEAYLQKMGYEDVPILSYRHFDKDHQHIHVIASSIKYSGEKISEFNDFYKNKTLCREIEKSFNLKVLTQNPNSNKDLSEINAEKYSLMNALNRGKKQGFYAAQFGSKIPKLSNEQFKNKFGEEEYNHLFDSLSEKGFILKTDKMKIKEILDKAYTSSANKDQFYATLDNYGLYHRELVEKGNKIVQYGLNGKYFHQKKLDRKYSQLHLNQYFKKNPVLTADEHKETLNEKVSLLLNKSTNYTDFKSILDINGIETKEATNSGGIYGLSFRLKGQEDFIKASDVNRGLSIKNIENKLELNLTLATSKTQVFKSKPADKVNTPPVSKTPGKGNILSNLGKAGDDSEEKKKKRKRDKDEDNEQSM